MGDKVMMKCKEVIIIIKIRIMVPGEGRCRVMRDRTQGRGFWSRWPSSIS